MITDKISEAKKILILGYGREGQSTEQFLKSKFPNLKIDTADKKDGPNYLDKIRDYEIIIKTPGISPHLPELIEAKKQGKLITSQTQIFFELCPGKIIGVTGTKGKSTTTSLIYHVLSNNGIKCVLVGNIGKPMLDYLPEITQDSWVVAELSSYQLMDLHISPHIAVLQNVYPDHLDYHKDFEEYKNAKLNIAKYQKPRDYFIHNLPLPSKPIESQLLGKHNQLNILPSIEIGKILGIPEDKILAAIKTFVPLETRLQVVAIKNGVSFYADTLATIPEATIAAIEALNPQTLIAGGHDRHQDYTELGKKIDESNIRTLILFPATGERIRKAITSKSIRCFLVNSMQEAVKLAFEHTKQNEICLLSPAAPSFTLFTDYKDEHEQYIKYIDEYNNINSGSKGLIIYKDKLLLILRDNLPNIPFPNTWEWSGGGKDENETLEETGLREMQEELNIRPKNYFFLGSINRKDRTVGRFLAILDDNEFKNISLGNEGQKYGLFTIEETLSMTITPGLRKFIELNHKELAKVLSGEPVNPKLFVLDN